MSCLIDTKTPGGEVNCIDDQTIPRTSAAIISRLDCKEIGTSVPWNWRLTVPKTTKMMLVTPLMTNWSWLWDDCSACYLPPPIPPPPSIKALTHYLCVGGDLWTDVCHPLPQLLASEVKQTFLSTNLVCLLAFEQWAAGPLTHTFQ